MAFILTLDFVSFLKAVLQLSTDQVDASSKDAPKATATNNAVEGDTSGKSFRNAHLHVTIVRASNRSSEGCGFDPHLGLRNHFLSIELEDHSSTIIYPSSHVSLTSN